MNLVFLLLVCVTLEAVLIIGLIFWVRDVSNRKTKDEEARKVINDLTIRVEDLEKKVKRMERRMWMANNV